MQDIGFLYSVTEQIYDQTDFLCSFRHSVGNCTFVYRIFLGLSTRPYPCCFLHTHEIFGLYFFLLESATLERILPPLGRASCVLVRQKSFVGQGHNLLCSLEQRILINSDCHATFTQKEVFSDQILFQYPLLKRSITAWLSVSIRTSGDI